MKNKIILKSIKFILSFFIVGTLLILFSVQAFAGDFIIWDSYSIIGPSVLQWNGLAMSDDGSYISGTVLNGPIYVSTDSGLSFTSRASNRAWRGIAMSANGQYQTAVVFGSSTVPGYIYRSTNYGTSWAQTGINKRWINIGMSKNGQYQTAISYQFSPMPARVLISSDYGASWSEVSALNNRTFGGIAVSETGQYQIISDTTRKVLYSSDYGGSWTQILETTNNYVQGLAISADGMYMTAVEDGGNIWISSNRGVSWTEIVNTKAWVNVEMSSDGQHQTAVSSGTSRYMAVSGDYGQTWTQAMASVNVQWTASAMSASGASQTIASFVSGSNSRIYKSTATCELIYTAGANGSITGTSPQDIAYGESGTAVTAVADPGYHFVDWSDGVTDNPRTDIDVEGNITVTANFAQDKSEASLYVIKHVINDNNGTATSSNFNLHVKQSGIDVAGSPAIGAESPGTLYTLEAGTYTVSEDAFSGYDLSFSGDCNTGGNITLSSGDTETCIITNNDNPSDSGNGTKPTPRLPRAGFGPIL